MPSRKRRIRRRPKIKRGVFKSGLEKTINKQLQRYPKIVATYEKDTFPYVLEKQYVCDFTIRTHNGKDIYVEVKGYFPSEDRTKMRAVKACNPDIDLRIVFDKNNRLSKASKMTYAEWSEKYGFPYAVGGIPKGWFDE